MYISTLKEIKLKISNNKQKEMNKALKKLKNQFLRYSPMLKMHKNCKNNHKIMKAKEH